MDRSLPSLLPQVISEGESNSFVSVASSDEIRFTIFSMDSLKAPGPDGFNAKIFKKGFWLERKEDITTMIATFFLAGTMPDCIDDTAITLIPKSDSPAHLKDFRPISLCNVLYKIISKILTNRLKPLLPRFISEIKGPSSTVDPRQIILS